MSDIFREIDEELRRDNLTKLWEKYGSLVIGFAVVVVLATAAVVGWREYQLRQRLADSVRYSAALDLARKNDVAQASRAFEDLARDAGAGQAVLARLEEAALRARSGDAAASVVAYKAIAQDGSVDTVYRDVATLLAALREVDTTDGKAVIDEVAPLTADGNPWRPTALEITALAHLRTGDAAKARDIYKALADDLTTPAGLRARAAEMVAALAG